MDPKRRPNHQLYLRSLERLGTAGRAAKAYELSEIAKRLFRDGLRRRFPNLTGPEFEALFLSSNWRDVTTGTIKTGDRGTERSTSPTSSGGPHR